MLKEPKKNCTCVHCSARRTELPALIAEVERVREALDECDRARVMIGAKLDSMNEVQKECAINEAWHILQRAIVKADTRAALGASHDAK